MENYTTYRTAESVSPKHPDKLCDQISDAILDAYLATDPDARVAVETCGGHNIIFIVGEITSHAELPNLREIVEHITDKPVYLTKMSSANHDDLAQVAQNESEKDISEDNIELFVNLVQQSPEIAQGVDCGGAGDQGIMIGYACDETPEMLPLEVILSRRLNQYIYSKYPFDGKTQITLLDSNNQGPNSDSTISNLNSQISNPNSATTNSNTQNPNSDSTSSNSNGQNPNLNNRNPKFVRSIVASFQNVPKAELKILVQEFIEQYQLHPIPRQSEIELHLNPAGDWHQGGFEADTGLTGRKLIVDNYGPRIPIGGGAFSGKDPSKVDRSAAYMARRIAVDYLRKHQAHEVFVRLAYAIGHDQPLETTVIIDGKPELITGYDLTPQGIINYLNLKRPIYEPSARYGHFGEGFDWDK